MAFARGDLITATGLDAINSEGYNYYSGHLDSNGTYGINMYFYSNVPSGEFLCSAESQCGWFSSSVVIIYKWEDGAFREKHRVSSEAGAYNGNVSANFNSYGPGFYCISGDSSNFAHHRNFTNVRFCKYNNIRGHFLKAIEYTPPVIRTWEDVGATGNPIAVRDLKSEILTTEILNNKQVFTSSSLTI